MRTPPRYLFVYGTLMRASRSPYARLLQARAQFLGEGYAYGQLYHLGRYPGAVFEDVCRRKVFGEVFRLKCNGLLDALDAYEGVDEPEAKGTLFQRQTIKVHLSQGQSVIACAYSFAGRTACRSLIASGRFPRPGSVKKDREDRLVAQRQSIRYLKINGISQKSDRRR